MTVMEPSRSSGRSTASASARAGRWATSRSSRATSSEDRFRYVSDPAFEHDVRKRVPSTDKAKQILGFEATTSLDTMLDEVIPWIRQAVADGTI